MRKLIFLICVVAIHNVSAQKFAPYPKKHKGYVFVDPVTMQLLPKLADLGPVNFPFQEGFRFRDGMLMIEKKDDEGVSKFGFINVSGDTVINPVYEKVSEFSEGFACVKFKGKWTFIDRQGNLLKQAAIIYSPIVLSDYPYSTFKEGLAQVRNENNKQGYIDRSGNLVIPFQFDDTRSFNEGIAAFMQNGKWGYIDKSGKIIVKPIYDYGSYGENGYIMVRKNGKMGVIDKTGKEIVSPEHTEHNVVKTFGKNFLVGNVNKWICVDPSGKEIFYKTYEEVWPFSEGLAAVSVYTKLGFIENYKWGFIDSSGKEVIPVHYDSIIRNNGFTGGFKGGIVFVKQNGKWSMIDKKGEAVGSVKFSSLSEYEDMSNLFHDGPVGIKMNGRWGYIDKNGKLIIPCIYEEVQRFKEGMAAVKLKGKYGYIDKSGKLVIPAKYYYALDFDNGIAEVGLTAADFEFPFYINKAGKEFRQK